MVISAIPTVNRVSGVRSGERARPSNSIATVRANKSAIGYARATPTAKRLAPPASNSPPSIVSHPIWKNAAVTMKPSRVNRVYV